MLLRTHIMLVAGTVGLAMFAAGAQAQATFQPLPNSLSLDDTGTLEGIQGNFIKFRSSKEEPWLLQVVPQTTLTIEGEADADYLRPGLTVELTGEFDKDSALTEPIKEIVVLGGRGKPTLGLFSAEDETSDAKPVRNPEPGKYRIRGKIAIVKDGETMIVSGRAKLTGKLDDEVKVKLNLDDAQLAQFGDTMKVKAWYYDQTKPFANRPGTALAEEIKISLSEPPTTGKQRPR